MATSGSFNTTAYGSYNRYVNFSWSIKTQSTANNYSVITWTLKGAGGSSTTNYYNSGPFKLTINGEVVYESDTRIQLKNGTVIATGEAVISHNSDGKKTFSASAEAAIYSYAINSTGSGSWELAQIPRAATLTSATKFTDEENPVITYSNLAGNSVSSLQACIASTDGKTIYVPYRDVSKTGTSYTFSLTTAERNTLRNACNNAKSMTVRFFLQSVIGGNTYWSTSDKTLSIVNANPTINATIIDTNSTITALTGDNNIMVKGYSNASITTGAVALKGATIKSTKIVNGNKSLTANGTINAVDSGTFTITITDSRGNTTTKTINKTLVNYIKPTVNLTGGNISTAGALTLTISGLVYNGSIGNTSNSNYAVSYCYSADGGSYTSWKSVSYSYKNNSYTATVNLTGLNYQSTYKFKARIIDKLNTITTTEVEIMSKPVFDWSKEDFNFNVPISINGETRLAVNNANTLILGGTSESDGVVIRPNGVNTQNGQMILQPNGNLALSQPLAVANGGTGATTAAGARTNLGLSNKGYNNSPIYITNSGATQCLGTTMYYQTNVVSTNNSTNKSFKVPGVIVACFISMRGDVNNWGIDLTINANSGVMDYSCYGKINNSLEQWAMNAYISPSDTVNMARYSGATTNVTCYCATLYVPTREG